MIGLGPIGGNLGTHLAEKGREVYGYGLDTARVAEWAQESGSAFSGSELAAVPWEAVTSVNAVSTGQSWMSDNVEDVAYDLLLKDVGLLRTELQHLPVTDLDGDVEGQILAAREALGVRAK